ncbi:MAG: isopentenyl-diphosphate Delta-isomerase [Acidobacteriota bacterium]
MRKITAGLVSAWHRFRYSADDLIVLVDEDGRPIGTAPKRSSHNANTKLHLAFSVFLFNQRGELLLQKRALTKKTWPGVWSNSCCGHLMPNESTDDAARRRLKYELGLSDVDLTIVLPDFRYRAEKDGVVENEICPVLIGVTDAQAIPHPSEVSNIQWIDWNEFLNTLNEPERKLSPWAEEEAQLLMRSDVFRNWFVQNIAASGASRSL